FADRKSPIAYGYGEGLPVYFNQAPLLQVSALPGGFGGGGGGGAPGGAPGDRVSGRGTRTDPDVVQAMPRINMPAPAPNPDGIPEEFRQAAGALIPPPNMRPRVVLRFASDEKNLLVSGMLAGGQQPGGQAGINDVARRKCYFFFLTHKPMGPKQTPRLFFSVLQQSLNLQKPGGGKEETPPPATSRCRKR